MHVSLLVLYITTYGKTRISKLFAHPAFLSHQGKRMSGIFWDVLKRGDCLTWIFLSVSACPISKSFHRTDPKVTLYYFSLLHYGLKANMTTRVWVNFSS